MSSVIIAPYTNDWPRQFAQVQSGLLAGFAEMFVQVEHIGSTSIPGLASKPVIDVMLGADTLSVIESRIEFLERSGYQYVSKYEKELPMRRYFVKPEGHSFPRVHLHGVVLGSQFWQEYITFRNALRSDSALLAEYQSLKIELAARFVHDKSSYTAAKTPFIRSVLTAMR
jgi:GrpB-like predicted nucleotidyltransferase (UPF0157 family)